MESFKEKEIKSPQKEENLKTQRQQQHKNWIWNLKETKNTNPKEKRIWNLKKGINNKRKKYKSQRKENLKSQKRYKIIREKNTNPKENRIGNLKKCIK